MTMNRIDSPAINDNRNYDYSSFPDDERKEYAVIAERIPNGARVLDLGCGNGSLLAKLKREKNTVGSGLEISESGIAAATKRGLNVLPGRIDERLPFDDNAFDVAVCNVTIQMVMYPEVMLQEMKRVSRMQIISFPNFAFWKNRLDLLVNGRMPRRMLFGYSWYSTGHIHQLSMSDFETLVNDVGGLVITDRWVDRSSIAPRNFLNAVMPNLFQLLAVYTLERR